MKTGQDFTLYAGQPLTVEFDVEDADGNPLDLSGFTTVLWRASKRVTEGDDYLLVEKSLAGGQIAVDASGNADVSIDSDDADNSDEGEWYHELSGTDALSQPVILASGTMTVEPSSTLGTSTDGAPTLTVGTNTYVTFAEADEFIDTLLDNEAWVDATRSNKHRALIAATRDIDGMLLRGAPAEEDQTLAFPRQYHPDDAPISRGQYMELTSYGYEQSAVPQDVEDAQCYEALAILAGGTSDRIALQREGVKSVTIGSTSETYSGSHNAGGSRLKLRSEDATAVLRPYLATAVSIT